MLDFSSDYTTGCHPRLLSRLIETNALPTVAYGEDEFSAEAKRKILAAAALDFSTCSTDDADAEDYGAGFGPEVYFLSGGTQTNAVVIGTCLAGCESVLAADTGHIALHEAGAIEYTGHKVVSLPAHEGKLDFDATECYLTDFYADDSHRHMPRPGMIYLSYPTEYGTLYNAAELARAADICERYNMRLYIDGARLGYGLAAATDVTLPLMAIYADAFYIGGTKMGALIGEAVVFPYGAPDYFFTETKRRGAMLAKGRVIGVQFDALFTDDLYLEIGREANALARRLAEGCVAKGYPLLLATPTNQQFVILPDEVIEHLRDKVRLSRWQRYDDTHTVVRMATSWSTTAEDVDTLLALL